MKLSNHRVAAAFVMGLLLGSYTYHTYMSWNRRGIDAFMSYELQRFDKHMAHPHALIFTLARGIITSAVFVALYELIALLFSRLLPPRPTAH